MPLVVPSFQDTTDEQLLQKLCEQYSNMGYCGLLCVSVIRPEDASTKYINLTACYRITDELDIDTIHEHIRGFNSLKKSFIVSIIQEPELKSLQAASFLNLKLCQENDCNNHCEDSRDSLGLELNERSPSYFEFIAKEKYQTLESCLDRDHSCEISSLLRSLSFLTTTDSDDEMPIGFIKGIL
ncbi:unnamed protein product [Moneuplotes crassus]|uniref:Uncharacterized protein n=1 Tax=Euplotes crassus TaxID=5936 RepID=A0AAD1UNT7_EUPCR|nr:unnamed protein product [Moneuplotes crassus]